MRTTQEACFWLSCLAHLPITKAKPIPQLKREACRRLRRRCRRLLPPTPPPPPLLPVLLLLLLLLLLARLAGLAGLAVLCVALLCCSACLLAAGLKPRPAAVQPPDPTLTSTCSSNTPAELKGLRLPAPNLRP